MAAAATQAAVHPTAGCRRPSPRRRQGAAPAGPDGGDRRRSPPPADRAPVAAPDGEVGDGTHTHPVRARPVEGAGTVEAVTGAYAAKYGDSPYVGPLLTEEAADATLRLEPRP